MHSSYRHPWQTTEQYVLCELFLAVRGGDMTPELANQELVARVCPCLASKNLKSYFNAAQNAYDICCDTNPTQHFGASQDLIRAMEQVLLLRARS
jgi:hypothetical protein